MGGSSFTQAHAPGEPTLNTPRMSPEEYILLKTTYLDKIQKYFPNYRVLPLIEAPEKHDYGDIDFVVALSEPPDFIKLATHLNAAGVICHNPRRCSLGVFKDGAASPIPAVVYKDTHGAKRTPTDTTVEEYAQIDVDVIAPELMDWYLFYSSYGDMAGLLGHIVTQLGFSINDRGLWVRLPELDFSKTVSHVNVADRDGTIFLCSDPRRVMLFLGLSTRQYAAGFRTIDALYEWLGSCRLISSDTIKVTRDNQHERNREQKRTVYGRFFHEWLPAHIDVSHEQDEEVKRERVRQLRQQHLKEAIDFFAKQEEYNTKHTALTLTLKKATAANLLKPLIAQASGKKDKGLNEILKAFRRFITFDSNGRPQIAGTAHADEASELHKFLGDDGKALRDLEGCREWVGENWERLRLLERERNKFGHGIGR